MSSGEVLSNENGDDLSPLSPTPADALEYSRSVSQDLRYLNDALTHAIEQLTMFNSETMSDLSLKYELMRNNEVGTHRLSPCSSAHAFCPTSESCHWMLRSAIDAGATRDQQESKRRIS